MPPEKGAAPVPVAWQLVKRSCAASRAYILSFEFMVTSPPSRLSATFLCSKCYPDGGHGSQSWQTLVHWKQLAVEVAQRRRFGRSRIFTGEQRPDPAIIALYATATAELLKQHRQHLTEPLAQLVSTPSPETHDSPHFLSMLCCEIRVARKHRSATWGGKQNAQKP